MKYSKTTTDKNQLSLKSSFPHRFYKKELPKISQKIVPVHLMEIKQMYQGKINDLMVLDQWAYVPIQTHKKSFLQRSHTEGNEVRMTASNSTVSEKFRSTSQIFLKKYLKRKQRKQMRENGNITNYKGVPEAITKEQNENSGFLQGIIRLKTSKLEKYRSQSLGIERQKRYNPIKSRTKQNEDLQEFKSQKMDLKQKLKIYETNIKNKKFQIKIGDKRYRQIQHSFQNM